MADRSGRSERVFKTAWFARAARKALIADAELCLAIRQVMQWQADDLGDGVFKKRLGKNLYRSIIVAKGGRYWVYEYLFAKQDQANIETEVLAKYRKLAKVYESLSDHQVAQLIQTMDWMEICNDG